MNDNQRLFAMYVIGQVESGHNWASVNYNDPITVGMMQWYGTRAARLCLALKAADEASYNKLASSLRSDLDTHDAGSSWWTTRYLSRAEGESWAASAEDDSNHRVQQQTFMTDIAGYEETFKGWGASDSNPKGMIFLASMYHQSPRECGHVVQTVGGGASLDTLYNACMNNGVLGRYRNRYNQVRDMLNAWDGAAAPPDFGQVDSGSTDPGGDIGGGGGNNNTSQAAGLDHLETLGECIAVVGTNGTRTLFYRASSGLWYPKTRTTAPENPGSGGGGGTVTPPAASGDFAKMFALWQQNANKWRYGQGAGRLNPPASGYSDCSACIWWAVNSIRPDIAKHLGTWTGAMVSSGTEIARGTRTTSVPLDKMQAGDIILIHWGSVNYAFNDGRSHVEWYVGNGENWGAGSAPLPHDSGKTTAYLAMAKVGCWMVRRFL